MHALVLLEFVDARGQRGDRGQVIVDGQMLVVAVVE
jgi:hypothetical protein